MCGAYQALVGVFCFLNIFFFSILPVWAANITPISDTQSDIDRLPKDAFAPLQRPIVKVLGGAQQIANPPQVVLADYDLLRKDFPVLRDLDSGIIDEWLIEHTSFLAETQLVAMQGYPVQSQISADFSIRKTALRPLGYGRALIVPVPGGGLIDVKGAGAEHPRMGSHSSGLATLGEGIREFMIEKLVSKAFDVDAIRKNTVGHEHQTVGTYAVIYPGFDVNQFEGGPYFDPATKSAAAGLILRQAHIRNTSINHVSHLPMNQALAIEKVLRQFGLSDTSLRPGYDFINTQGTDTGAVVDFGTFTVFSEFRYPVRHSGYELPEFGYPNPSIILYPNEVLIVPELQIQRGTWGEDYLRPRIAGWVNEFKNRSLSSEQLRKRVSELLDQTFSQWPSPISIR